ncbi:polyprotein [Swagivirus HG]|uniref:polyprotein n=1 Tax=Swagivirus HG TaxID=1929030 RepID=UPI000945E764|nr:polyprotein [Swagivirus HG]APO40852.1 polyprotein [Swagivirus HG]
MFYNGIFVDRHSLTLEEIFYDLGRDLSRYFSFSEVEFLKLVLMKNEIPRHRFWRELMDDSREFVNFSVNDMGHIGNRITRLDFATYCDLVSMIGHHDQMFDQDMYVYVCRVCGFHNNYNNNCLHVNEIGCNRVNDLVCRVSKLVVKDEVKIPIDEEVVQQTRFRVKRKKITVDKVKNVLRKKPIRKDKFFFSNLNERVLCREMFSVLSSDAEQKITTTIEGLNSAVDEFKNLANNISVKLDVITPVVERTLGSVDSATIVAGETLTNLNSKLNAVSSRYEDFKMLVSSGLKPNILSMASAFIADIFWVVVGHDWREEMVKFITRYILIFNVPGVVGSKVMSLIKGFTSVTESQSLDSLYKLILPLISMLFFDRITKGEWITKKIAELGTRGRDLNNIRLGTSALKDYAESFYQTISDLVYDLCGEQMPEFLKFDKEIELKRKAQTVMKEAVEVVALARLEENRINPMFRLRISKVIVDIDELIVNACAGQLPQPIQRNLWTLRREVEPILKKITFCKEQKTVRPDPYCVYFSGPSGIGKSGATPRLISKIVEQAEYDFTNPVVYTRPPAAKYETNYVNQPIVCIDDGFMSKKGKDEGFFMAAKSVAPFGVEQADLPDKGQQFTSDLILVNSNFDYPNPEDSKHNPALLRRRNLLWHVEATGIEMDPTDDHVRHLRFVLLDPSNANSLASTSPADYISFDQMCDFTLKAFDEYMRVQCRLLASYPGNIGGIVLPTYKKARYYYEYKETNLAEGDLQPEICVQMLSDIVHGSDCRCNSFEDALDCDDFDGETAERIYSGGSMFGIPNALYAHSARILDGEAVFEKIPEAYTFAYRAYLFLTHDQRIDWTRSASMAWTLNPAPFEESLHHYGLSIRHRFLRWYKDNISDHRGREFAVHCIIAGGIAVTAVGIGLAVKSMLKPSDYVLSDDKDPFNERLKDFVVKLDEAKCEAQSNEVRTKYMNVNKYRSESFAMVKIFDEGMSKFKSESNEVRTKYSKLNRFVLTSLLSDLFWWIYVWYS